MSVQYFIRNGYQRKFKPSWISIRLVTLNKKQKKTGRSVTTLAFKKWRSTGLWIVLKHDKINLNFIWLFEVLLMLLKIVCLFHYRSFWSCYKVLNRCKSWKYCIIANPISQCNKNHLRIFEILEEKQQKLHKNSLH